MFGNVRTLKPQGYLIAAGVAQVLRRDTDVFRNIGEHFDNFRQGQRRHQLRIFFHAAVGKTNPFLRGINMASLLVEPDVGILGNGIQDAFETAGLGYFMTLA